MNTIINKVYEAVNQNDLELMKQLLTRYNISLKDMSNQKHIESVVFLAVRKNYQDIVLFLVKNGANVNSCESLQISPLLSAISEGNFKMTELLLHLGANKEAGKFPVMVEGKSSYITISPLHVAVSSLHLEIVILLLAKGANINGRNSTRNETVLHTLANCDEGKRKIDVQIKVAKVLLDSGADIDARNCFGMTAVDLAIRQSKPELFKLLFEEGAPVKMTKVDGTYHDYLHLVITYPCRQLARLCLEGGCDFKRRVESHGLITPFHAALKFGKPDLVKVFLEFSCPYDLPLYVKGRDKALTLCPPNNENMLFLTIQKDFIEGIKANSFQSVKAALTNGAEPKGCSIDVPSTLHHTAANGNHELLELLLMNGVPVNSVNANGETPLFITVTKKDLQASKILLKFGGCINLSSRNNYGVIGNYAKLQKLFKTINTCFTLVKEGNKKCLEIVKNYDLSGNNKMLSVLMNCVNGKGLSLMAMALQLGHFKIADDLMKLRIEKL